MKAIGLLVLFFSLTANAGTNACFVGEISPISGVVHSYERFDFQKVENPSNPSGGFFYHYEASFGHGLKAIVSRNFGHQTLHRLRLFHMNEVNPIVEDVVSDVFTPPFKRLEIDFDRGSDHVVCVFDPSEY